VFGALVLAGVVAIGADPRFLGAGAQSSTAPLGAPPSASGVASSAAALPVASSHAVTPSPPAVHAREFWVEIRRKGRVLERIELVHQPGDNHVATIPIPRAWRTQLPTVVLLGRPVPSVNATRLFSIRLALPATPRLEPALNLAGGLTVIIDPMPAPTGSFDPGPMEGYLHTWSYSADLQWASGGGQQLVVTVALQLGVY
jgi:hypothetical protein